ncbi:hypothetical protein KBC85_01320 [Candidatus Saccharibacteria bacterium]|nr:hypothetical protein [Candidatus Saccharibacteria bacterium]MDQ5885053.1 hypothetical protein [Patescibacteria group bacterium]MDQ5953923.1 hypothetical protein [Patescibacteria group bacterium]MDQ5958482.1 hypothetical protein [Patescibacteria group bacterium]
MNKILFIHRSVGENLINDGKIYQNFISNSNIDFNDYNVNTKILRNKYDSKKLLLDFPNNNTTPKDYSELFNNTNYQNTIDYILSFNTVIIKSCYPNSNIKTNQELIKIKDYYTKITSYYSNLPNKLIIVTSPPLVPFKTNSQNAKRAKELSNWLTNSNFGGNISTFNLFNLLAEKDGKNTNMLKKQYRRLLPFDSHPNKIANQKISPMFIDCMLNDTIYSI